MKYEKSVTIGLPKFSSVKVGVTEMSSFEECDKQLIKEIEEMDIHLEEDIKQALKWNESAKTE